MPNLLSELIVDEISLVEDGANPGAKIMLSKMKKATPLKTEHGIQYPVGDYAYVPDRNAPDSWKLRLTAKPGGGPDARIVGAALAALGPTGFRGNKVKIPTKDLPAVKAKVAAAWRKLHPEIDELPLVLRKSGDNDMSEDEIKALLEQNNIALMEMITAMMEEKMAKAEDDDEEEMAKAEDDDEDDPKEDDEEMISEEVTKKLDAQTAIITKQREDMDAQAKVIANLQKSNEISAFVSQASAELSHLPGTSAEKGEMLYNMAKSMPDQFEKSLEMLKAGNVAMESVTKSEAGDGRTGTTSAYDAIVAKAREYAEADGISEAQGINKVRKQNPELWNKHRAEKRS